MFGLSVLKGPRTGLELVETFDTLAEAEAAGKKLGLPYSIVETNEDGDVLDERDSEEDGGEIKVEWNETIEMGRKWACSARVGTRATLLEDKAVEVFLVKLRAEGSKWTPANLDFSSIEDGIEFSELPEFQKVLQFIKDSDWNGLYASK